MLERFVIEHRHKTRPRGVGYGFREMMIAYHAFYIKALKSDDLVFVHQLSRCLVQVVCTAVIYLLMDHSDLPLLLLYVGAFG